MRIGVVTGGGDCPGMNAAIRAVVRRGARTYGDEMIGFCDGWRGVLEDRARTLDIEACRGILPRGGTILGTSRTDPFAAEGGQAAVLASLNRREVDALVVVGGRATLLAAHRLALTGVHVVAIPKAIDNDLGGTDVSLGFLSAVQTATDAIDRLHTTAESHDRVLVCQVRGRHSGWIATWAGIAGGAAEILVPEEPVDVDEVCAHLARRRRWGRFATIVVVAEGARLGGDGAVRFGEIGQRLAEQIEHRTGVETRLTVVANRCRTPLGVVREPPRTVDPALLRTMAELFGGTDQDG